MNTRAQGFISRLKQISKKADKIDPGTAGLTSLLGPAGSGLYAAAKGEPNKKLESGLRVGGRTAVEGLGGAVGAAGLATALVLAIKAHNPSLAQKIVSNPAAGTVGGLGAVAGGIHGARSSAKNINRENEEKSVSGKLKGFMKKKSLELKFAGIGSSIGGMISKAKPAIAQAGGDLVSKLRAVISKYPRATAGAAGAGAGALGTAAMTKKEPSLSERLQGLLA